MIRAISINATGATSTSRTIQVPGKAYIAGVGIAANLDCAGNAGASIAVTRTSPDGFSFNDVTGNLDVLASLFLQGASNLECDSGSVYSRFQVPEVADRFIYVILAVENNGTTAGLVWIHFVSRPV